MLQTGLTEPVNPEYANDIIECVRSTVLTLLSFQTLQCHTLLTRIGSAKTAIGFMHADVPVNFEDGDDEKQVKTLL